MKYIISMMLCVILMSFSAAMAGTLKLPESLTTIDDEAFAGDKSLDKVVVPEGVERVGSRAFADSSVKSLKLPDTLSSMADDAIEGCGDVEVSALEGSYGEEWKQEKELDEYDKKATPANAFSYSFIDDVCVIDRYRGNDTIVNDIDALTLPS